MTGILCPLCGSSSSDVKDSRPTEYGIRRRRSCADCRHRFKTVEITAEDEFAIAGRVLAQTREQIIRIAQTLSDVAVNIQAPSNKGARHGD